MIKEHYNIIFCVYGCDTVERYKNEITKMESTWITSNVKALFFLGEQGPLQGPNYIHLENVGNDYMSAADKQYLGLKYVHDYYTYDYVCVCGTDTYMVVPRLQKYLSQFSPTVPLAVGGHGDSRNICGEHVHYFAGGCGIVLSHAAVTLMYNSLDKMQERWLDLCVANNYITWIPACDLSLCYFMRECNITFYYANGLMFACNYYGYNNTPHGLFKCCDAMVNLHTLISCHNMSPADFDAFHNILSVTQ
jgi:hypothetical protein